MQQPFRPFNPNGATHIYKTNLPHWRQDGCTYFVTFRLADSIPAAVLEGWEHEKRVWLNANGITWDESGTWMKAFLGLPSARRQEFGRVFERKSNTYLDEGHGECILRDPEHSRIVIDSLKHFDEERYDLYDTIIMPNHAHALIAPRKGFVLETILGNVKSYTATVLNKKRQTQGAVWQKHSYDHIVRDEKEFWLCQQYIARNPVKGRLKSGEYVLYRP